MKNNIIDVLKKVGAILINDHFVYTSGKHGDLYINKDFLYPHAKETSYVGMMFAEKFKGKKIEVVVAPAVGGAILCTWTAHHLSRLDGKEVLSVYTEKDKGTTASAAESEQIFRRGYDKYVKGKKVLVIEDLTTTGISVKKTVEATKKAGGIIVAVCVMVNRNPQNVNSKLFGAPFYALGEFPAKAYEENVCPLCKRGIPINTIVGHGKKYLENNKK
ncbi:phosphoribosyltransferase [Candidatus Roizmanbacteria bacterium]|jgi:orotate phosphoribosyltransferase|nr:phosphoribosyltransferase [Candidatus Roizmanbacteria bacterium]